MTFVHRGTYTPNYHSINCYDCTCVRLLPIAGWASQEAQRERAHRPGHYQPSGGQSGCTDTSAPRAAARAARAHHAARPRTGPGYYQGSSCVRVCCCSARRGGAGGLTDVCVCVGRGAMSQLVCQAGTYTNAAAATSCTACNPGARRGAQRGWWSISCARAAGYWQGASAQTGCSACGVRGGSGRGRDIRRPTGGCCAAGPVQPVVRGDVLHEL